MKDKSNLNSLGVSPQVRTITALPADRPTWGTVAVGTVLGDSYRLIRRLAQGGMGDIYLATHERLPGTFVVKILNAELAHDHEAFVRFQREAVVMTALRHPNVVQVVDFNSTADGMPYLVMEHLQGEDLAQILGRRRSLTPTEVSRIVRKVAYGLDAGHRQGIIHRDLKPENVMVVPCPGQADVVKVIDFGISKARRFGPVTNASTVIGTPEFMSPEQAQGKQDEVGAPSDQFALAVITYVLLTGQTPWGVADAVETLHRVVNHPPLPLATHVMGSYPSIESVLFRALSKSPSERYPSTLAYSRALDRAIVMDGLLPDTVTPEPGALDAILHTPTPLLTSTEPDWVPPMDERTSPPLAVPQEGFVELEASSVVPPTVRDLERSGGFSPGPFAPPSAVEPLTPGPSPARRRRPRVRYLWEGVVLLLALVGGASVGFLDVPTVRAQTTRGLRAVQGLMSAVTHSTAATVDNLSKVLKRNRAEAAPGPSQ